MATLALGSVVRQIESLFDGGSVAGMSDRQLLDRFTAGRDAEAEAAFAALVLRHGPMVLGVCREMLGDRHHAEDAFQAVFLILARKARSLRDPDLLGNWLYGVALRTSRYAKLRLGRDRKNEEAAAMVNAGSSVTVPSAEQSFLAREQADVLHEEIARLPRGFRLAVVLCYLEGHTVHEAARRLRCSHGTVRSRMARARDKLRRSLIRRGVILPAVAVTAALSARSASASVSTHLCETTTRAAIQFTAGQSAAPLATALAHEVLRSMFVHKLKFIALTLLLFGAVATSAGFLAHALARNDEPKSPAANRQAPVAAKPDDGNPKAAPGRMFVVGRVLDPQGKPVPGAAVMACARATLLAGGGEERMYLTVLGHADADASGRFRLDALRTSSSRNDECMAIALAPGYGVGWAEIDPDAGQPAADIALRPEHVIQGRLFDLQGRPAQGIVVSVTAIQRLLVPDLPGRDRLRVRVEGPSYWWARVNDIPAWPKPATTDADGRFEMHGIGHRLQAQLSIVDPRFARQMIEVETDDAPGAKSIRMALQPAKVLAGRVTYADTGKPAPRALIEIHASETGQRGRRPTDFRTDDDGRFRANPSPGDRFFVRASPPKGELYLAASKQVEWPKGAVEQTVDLALPRGVVIRGSVTEEGSKAPVAGASVEFVPHIRKGVDVNAGMGQAETAADGSFKLAVRPGAGHLAVQASSEDFVLREIGNREFLGLRPGGRRLYSHSFVACDPQPGGPGVEIHVALRRAETVSGRIFGLDDRPAPDTWIIGRAALGPSAETARRLWSGDYHGNAPSGRFELHGLDTDSEFPVYFFQPTRKLGAVVLLSGKAAAGGPVTIRLQPCGTAVARLVDAKGQPLARYRDEFMISLIIAPGSDSAAADENRPFTEGAPLTRIDSINYANEPESDPQGRIMFPALIPGASYRIADRTAIRYPSLVQVRKDFTVKPGETLFLGDILIEKPPAR